MTLSDLELPFHGLSVSSVSHSDESSSRYVTSSNTAVRPSVAIGGRRQLAQIFIAIDGCDVIRK